MTENHEIVQRIVDPNQDPATLEDWQDLVDAQKDIIHSLEERVRELEARLDTALYERDGL